MLINILLCAVFVAVTVAVTLGAYFLMRAIVGGDPEAKNRELANSILLRISALHVLIIALVFAQEMIEYQQLKFQSSTEANAIGDMYFDAGRYGGAEAKPIQEALAEYVRLVIDEEWALLGRTGRLSPAAWDRWDAAYLATLDLKPADDRQRSLRDHMLASIHVISEIRIKRENNGVDAISGVFWFAAVSGVIFIALGYYTYPPEWRHLALLGMFGAYTGIILFFIYAFSNPYRPPAELNPGAYERLQLQIRKAGTHRSRWEVTAGEAAFAAQRLP